MASLNFPSRPGPLEGWVSGYSFGGERWAETAQLESSVQKAATAAATTNMRFRAPHLERKMRFGLGSGVTMRGDTVGPSFGPILPKTQELGETGERRSKYTCSPRPKKGTLQGGQNAIPVGPGGVRKCKSDRVPESQCEVTRRTPPLVRSVQRRKSWEKRAR